ncbi:MAG TPA: aminoacyl--tRNA ligase-related protein, partial [Pseudolabrys sp.]|nr:aminoacyl--tRNA ligase-related protein [Pseudolabrys sp.]
MYDMKWIREHPDAFDRGLKRRGLEPLSKKLLALDETRRALIAKLEQAQARRNAASKEIGQAKARKDETTASKLMAEVAELKTAMPDMEAKEKEASAALDKELAQIPNMPADDVPDGADASGNVERHQFGKKRDYAFKPKQHFELGEALGQMDFELAAKLSGARFVVLQKGLARMERALGQLFLDVHTQQHGYTEVNPPVLVRSEAMFGTAQLPKFEADQFYTPFDAELSAGLGSEFSACIDEIAKARDKQKKLQDELDAGALKPRRDDIVREIAAIKVSTGRLRSRVQRIVNLDRLWLIPTAEVPLTNLVRESIVDEAQLPMRLTACTPCFRAEAGAAGKDTRGMIR